MKISTIYFVLVIVAGFALGGCATTPPPAPAPEPVVMAEPEPEPMPEPEVVMAEPEPEPEPQPIIYTVQQGDTLWSVSGMGSIYNDVYRWPLIYKANSSQIDDADLIYPGQVFTIDSNPGMDEIDAAIRHAKTRGPWSLGVVEDSDRAYLAQ